MIIESAFFRLPDYLRTVESPGELYESQLVFMFAVALYQELSSRGLFHLLPYIQLNKPYPRGGNRKADVYFRVPTKRLSPELLTRWCVAGVCEENWIEVEYYGGLGIMYGKRQRPIERSATRTKAANALKLLNSLLRLEYYAGEGCKYLLAVFDTKPDEYLPFKSMYVLKPIFEKPGVFNIKIPVDQVTRRRTAYRSMDKRILDELEKAEKAGQRELSLDIIVYSIKPIQASGLVTPPPDYSEKSTVHYFYLMRLLEPPRSTAD
ncbi:MAG: hypothetical protein QXG15_02850 [Desulfurococcaceae archaeon]